MENNHEVKADVTVREKQLETVKQETVEEMIERVDPAPKPVEAPKAEDDEESIGPENPLKLKNPIRINGEMVSELSWTEDITSQQFLQADSLAHGSRASFSSAEMDNGLHFWLGVMMIVADNPRIDPKDLEQVRGKDNPKILRLGRFFMMPDAEED